MSRRRQACRDRLGGTRPDAEAAIGAARRAFDTGPWPRTPERERGALLLRTADLIERDAKEFARAESLDTGKRLVESEYDIADVVSCFRHYGGIGGTDAGRVIDTGRDDAVSRVVYEPVGVCGLITPWNYPSCKPVGRLLRPSSPGTPSSSSPVS